MAPPDGTRVPRIPTLSWDSVVDSDETTTPPESGRSPGWQRWRSNPTPQRCRLNPWWSPRRPNRRRRQCRSNPSASCRCRSTSAPIARPLPLRLRRRRLRQCATCTASLSHRPPVRRHQTTGPRFERRPRRPSCRVVGDVPAGPAPLAPCRGADAAPRAGTGRGTGRWRTPSHPGGHPGPAAERAAAPVGRARSSTAGAGGVELRVRRGIGRSAAHPAAGTSQGTWRPEAPRDARRARRPGRSGRRVRPALPLPERLGRRHGAVRRSRRVRKWRRLRRTPDDHRSAVSGVRRSTHRRTRASDAATGRRVACTRAGHRRGRRRHDHPAARRLARRGLRHRRRPGVPRRRCGGRPWPRCRTGAGDGCCIARSAVLLVERSGATIGRRQRGHVGGGAPPGPGHPAKLRLRRRNCARPDGAARRAPRHRRLSAAGSARVRRVPDRRRTEPADRPRVERPGSRPATPPRSLRRCRCWPTAT